MNNDILRDFAGKRCLVTGGTGLIGRQVVDILCDAGAEVGSVSLDDINNPRILWHFVEDLTNFETCKRVTKGMDYVFHLAGSKGSVKATKDRPADFFIPMLMVNTNVLEACRLNNIEKVVYTSSIGAYSQAEVLREEDGMKGSPMDFYPGMAKRMGELQIWAYQQQYSLFNYSIVRLTNVYGPGDRLSPDAMVITALMSRIKSGESPLVVWGDGNAVRDFVYSRDAAEGIIQALYYGTLHSSYGELLSNFVNIGSGIGYSIRELVETLHRFIDFDYKFDPSKPSGYPKRVMDISLARKLIHYNPTTSLLDGLKRTWESLK